MIPSRRRSIAWLFALSAFLGLTVPFARAQGAEGALRGTVRIELQGVSIPTLLPTVVFLTPLDQQVLSFEVPAPVEIRQKNARFSPAFRAIVKGQTVDMPNVDTIYHNVFSFSRPNDFELGTYPVGESRSVTFEHAGVVKTYCSIHESMNATIFVAPNPYFSVVASDGRFALEDVPAGRYRLETWSDKLPSSSREIVIEAGTRLELDVMIEQSRS